MKVGLLRLMMGQGTRFAQRYTLVALHRVRVRVLGHPNRLRLRLGVRAQVTWLIPLVQAVQVVVD